MEVYKKLKVASWFVHNSSRLFLHSVAESSIIREKSSLKLSSSLIIGSAEAAHKKSVLFHQMWRSLNLISISKAADIGFATLQQFSKPGILNSLKNSSYALVQCPCVRFRSVIIYRQSLQGREVLQGWAPGTVVPSTPSLLLLLLPPRSPTLIRANLGVPAPRPGLARGWRVRTRRRVSPAGATLCCPLAGVPAVLPGLSPHCTIGRYLQNTSSKIKLLRISRQQQPQGIKRSARALPGAGWGRGEEVSHAHKGPCIRGVSRTVWCLHPAFTLETCFNVRWISDETKGTGYLCP